MSEMVKREIGFPLRVSAYRFGLELPKDCTWDEYVQVGRHLSTIETLAHESLDWWLGDFCNAGNALFGEKYAQALDVTDYSKASLVTMAYVSRHVKPENRILPQSFMAAVAAKEEGEQKRLAERCKDEGLLQSEFRRLVRGDKDYRKQLPRDISKTAKHLKLEDDFDRIYGEHERAWSVGTAKENARAVWKYALYCALGRRG